MLEDIIIVFKFLKDYQGENILYGSKQHNYYQWKEVKGK